MPIIISKIFWTLLTLERCFAGSPKHRYKLKFLIESYEVEPTTMSDEYQLSMKHATQFFLHGFFKKVKVYLVYIKNKFYFILANGYAYMNTKSWTRNKSYFEIWIERSTQVLVLTTWHAKLPTLENQNLNHSLPPLLSEFCRPNTSSNRTDKLNYYCNFKSSFVIWNSCAIVVTRFCLCFMNLFSHQCKRSIQKLSLLLNFNLILIYSQHWSIISFGDLTVRCYNFEGEIQFHDLYSKFYLCVIFIVVHI